jgi:hypothetical protein
MLAGAADSAGCSASLYAVCRRQTLPNGVSSIMRTTLNIDDFILKEVKALHEKERRSMGAVVSELLAEALARRRLARARPPFHWTSRNMKALIDISDKKAQLETR